MQALWTRRSPGFDLVGSTINITDGNWLNPGAMRVIYGH